MTPAMHKALSYMLSPFLWQGAWLAVKITVSR